MHSSTYTNWPRVGEPRRSGWKGRHIEKILQGEGQNSLNPLSVFSLALSSSRFRRAPLHFRSLFLAFSAGAPPVPLERLRFYWLYQEPTTPSCCISIIEFLAVVRRPQSFMIAREGDMFCVRFIRERSHEETCACHRREIEGRGLFECFLLFPPALLSPTLPFISITSRCQFIFLPSTIPLFTPFLLSFIPCPVWSYGHARAFILRMLSVGIRSFIRSAVNSSSKGKYRVSG